MSEVRIYVEGGGDGKDGKAIVRMGFAEFFRELIDEARRNKVGWKLVACGSRASAYRNFCTALDSHPDSFNVLLVDSEGPVTTQSNEFLRSRDSWDLNRVSSEQCHLMVQMVESWFLADIDALKRFYGQGFSSAALPRNPNVEAVNKSDLDSALKKATRPTSKGQYHKIRHGPKILATLDSGKVRGAASHCEKLFVALRKKLSTS